VLKVPSDSDLVLKLTHSGVTFLHERRFKKRYTGSKACAIDIEGRMWLRADDLLTNDIATLDGGELVIVRVIKEDKKKKVRKPPNLQNVNEIDTKHRVPELGAISEILPDQQNLCPSVENFATKDAKKPRKKSYSVDKAAVRQRIYAMVNTMKGKKRLFFWTVSFPEGTPDDTCYKAFNTWLTSLRQRGMLHDYLWIAERQEGDRLKDKTKQPTHTIHFHIAIPHYLDVQKANAMMRGTLKGYAKKGLMPGAFCTVSAAPSLRKYSYTASIAKYNGVDICKDRKTRKPINFAVKKGQRALAHYLTKYVTKNDAGQVDDKGELIAPGFEHFAWHCSRGFSRLFTGVTCTIKEFQAAGLGGYLNRVRVFKMEFATFVPWLFGPPPMLEEHLYKLNSYIQKQFDNEQQPAGIG
jgi:hypothetical protein